MKKIAIGLMIFLVLLFTLPLIMLKGCEKKVEENNFIDNEAKENKILLTVYRTDINKPVEMDIEEYVLGVLAGEMPASFHEEALKAQALAARTYTVMRVKAFGGKGCLEHPEADICTDSVHCQAYVKPSTLSNANYKRLKSAVEDTRGEVITYQDNLIDAVFHSTSGGRTADSEDVWQSKIPYLRGVISQFEEHSPKYVSLVEVSNNEFISKIKKLDTSIKVNTKKLKDEIKITEKNEGGRIITMTVGNKEFKGEKIRRALGLNSSNFNITFNGNSLIFSVIGNGHGIGLSQYGADGMGKEGYEYKDIINHYYTDVEIIDIYEFKIN